MLPTANVQMMTFVSSQSASTKILMNVKIGDAGDGVREENEGLRRVNCSTSEQKRATPKGTNTLSSLGNGKCLRR